MRKRLLSIALCLCMVLTLLPTAALAGEDKGSAASIEDGLAIKGLAEDDTFTVGTVTYTYKGDATSAAISMVTGNGDAIPLTDSCIWKAGSGYVLYHPTETGPITGHNGNYVTAAEVTLHGATVTTNSEDNPAIKLPYYQYGAEGQQPTNVTLTLEGNSTLTGNVYALGHYNGSLNIVGGASDGTLTLNGQSILGPTTIGSGASVIQGVGTEDRSGAKTTNLNNSLTVENGGSYTIAGGATLYAFRGSIDVKQGSALTIAAGGTLDLYASSPAILTFNGTVTNSGSIYFKDGVDTTLIPTNITGAGAVRTVTYEYPNYVVTATLVLSGGKWLVSGGDVNSTGLDLTTAPAAKTVYTAGTNGTILWEPVLSGDPASVTGGTLTFTGATVSVSGNDRGGTTAFALPGNVRVVFKGTNSITATDTNNAVNAFGCNGATTFDLAEGSDTTLIANGWNAYAVSLYSGSVEIVGSGKLNITANGSDGAPCAILARNESVTLTSGALDIPSFVSGNVTLGGVTILVDATLDLSAAASVTKGDTGATVYGMLKLKNGTTSAQINALGLTGTGTVRVGDTIYRYSNGKWVLAVPLDGLKITDTTPKTTWQAGSGTVTYIPAAAPANAQLIFDGAHMSVSPEKGNATAVTLPNAVVDVIFKGENEISATALGGNAVTFSASANTTFTAETGSKTTLGASGDNSKAISAGGNVTLTGTGELLLAPTVNSTAQKPNGYAIHAAGQNVTIDGGLTVYEPRVNTDSSTAAKNGTGGILAGAVNLGAATIPAGGTLDLHGADSVLRSASALVNNGTLLLPNDADVNDMNLTGSGLVKIGDSYYKNVGGKWVTDITYTGLDLTDNNAPLVETTYTAGEGTVTYTPGEGVNPPTLTLNNATIAPLVQGSNTVVPPLTLGSAKLVLVGDSYLKGTGVPALCGNAEGGEFNSTSAGSITIGGSGSLLLEGRSNLGSFGADSLTLEDTATVTSVGGTVGAVTVGEKATLNAILKVDGKQTVYGTNTIDEGVTQFYTDALLQWTDGASIKVNGSLMLAKGTNFADVKGKLSGDGVVRIVTEMDDAGKITKWAAYLTNGTALHTYEILDFSVLPGNDGAKREGTTLERDGYSFTGNATDGYVITLGDLDINYGFTEAALSLPADGKVEVKLAGNTCVESIGTAMQFGKETAEYPCTISGSGSLRMWSYTSNAVFASQPLTIAGGTLRSFTISTIQPAIRATSGLTLSGMRIASPSGAVVGRYEALSCDTVLVDGKPAASVSIAPIGGGGGGISNYTLTFETNGGSAIAAVSKLGGTAADLSAYVPTREGYVFTGWYSDEALTEKITSVKMTKSMTVYAKWSAAALPFTDVKAADWFYDDVAYVYEKGLMQGTGDTAFDPHGTTTRGMIVTILYRLEGEPAVTGANPFDDVASGKYYENAVIWAAANSIVGGYGNRKFGPEDPITREQMAAILYRYAQYKGYDVSAAADLSKFSDENIISPYAKTALSWANAGELITGKGNGILDPHGNAERCQVAAILHRFCENVMK